ncbi:MAG: Crp/Fnr family transcriptional regulator [Deltaproteobacteria bacterium]|nr:Crp/Fnr family transcriptional regulator [Deltaproteobacteria bacterium]
MDRRELLRKIPLFSPLSDEIPSNLYSTVRLQKIKQGQVIFRKGDEGTALYILRSGTIKIVLPSRLGAEIIISIFSDGDFFGEMALLDGEPRSADAVAIKPSELLVLSRNDFLSFLQSDVNAVNAILSVLTKRMRKTHDLLEDVCFLTISQRLSKLILELGKIYGRNEGDSIILDISLTQKELGDMIGATRESINKELKMLRERGLIEMKGNQIQICDLSRLKRKAR